MRLGLIARVDNRGLAVMHQGFHEHLKPDAVLVVDMRAHSPHEHRFERYPDALVLTYEQMLAEPPELKAWLADLDVLLSIETFYLDRLPDLAREVGCRTVMHCMGEFARWRRYPDLPKPDVMLSPTPWLIENTAMDTVVLPMPVDRDRCAFRRRGTGDITFLHIAGHKAIHDRNGTMALAQAWKQGVPKGSLLVRSQSNPMIRPSENVRVIHEDTDDYARLYDEGDVLVLTRRYGGQALSIDQALSCGLPVIGTDREPERSLLPLDWLVPAVRGRSFNGQPGPIPMEDPDPSALNAKLRQWSAEPSIVYDASLVADEIAESFSWATLGPVWINLLAEVAR